MREELGNTQFLKCNSWMWPELQCRKAWKQRKQECPYVTKYARILV